MSVIKQQPAHELEQAPTLPDYVYAPNALVNTFSLLLMGRWGTGKTVMAGSSNYPILFYMFDPKSAIVLRRHYPEQWKNGMIQVLPFWDERKDLPTQFARFDYFFSRHKRSGVLDNYGTIVVDSFTTFSRAIYNHWLLYKNWERRKRQEIARKGDPENLIAMSEFAIGDYQGFYSACQDIVSMISSTEANFIMTGHLKEVENEKTKIISQRLQTFGQLSTILPAMFSEKWVILKKKIVQPPWNTFSILTKDFGQYEASTQIGAGIFEKDEKADLRYLLKKADMQWEDKPFFAVPELREGTPEQTEFNKTWEDLNKEDARKYPIISPQGLNTWIDEKMKSEANQ
jgi:hypothetical protein